MKDGENGEKSLEAEERVEIDSGPTKVNVPNDDCGEKHEGNDEPVATDAAETADTDAMQSDGPSCSTDQSKSSAPPTRSVKNVQNWKKIIRLGPSLADKLSSEQLFKSPLPAYVPCVPPGTSQRLVEYLTDKDVDQLCCPGCKDR